MEDRETNRRVSKAIQLEIPEDMIPYVNNNNMNKLDKDLETFHSLKGAAI